MTRLLVCPACPVGSWLLGRLGGGCGAGSVADDVVPQGRPCWFPGSVPGWVQDRFALGSGGRRAGMLTRTAQGGPARGAMAGAGQRRCGAQQGVGDPRAAQALLAPNRPEGMWARGAVDEVGEGRFDDGV